LITDVNTASREDLIDLVGIGNEIADAIIRARPFESIDDLISIPGIGQATLERLAVQGVTANFEVVPPEGYLDLPEPHYFHIEQLQRETRDLKQRISFLEDVLTTFGPSMLHLPTTGQGTVAIPGTQPGAPHLSGLETR